MYKELLDNLKLQKDWQAFWQNKKDILVISKQGNIASLPSSFAVMAGSFNPLHQGHKKLAEVAEKILKKEVIFELSIANVDKPWLDEITVAKRLTQFIDYKAITITKAATFLEKTNLFGRCDYILGYDTASRLFSPKYYKDNEDMINSLREITKRGAKFLVACRKEDQKIKTLSDIDIPKEFQSFFSPIPQKIFYVDISSTALRSSGNSL
ncbi:MAG: hypothetical protein WAQ98_01545 [Blastocatellia bacterium]